MLPDSCVVVVDRRGGGVASEVVTVLMEVLVVGGGAVSCVSEGALDTMTFRSQCATLQVRYKNCKGWCGGDRLCAVTMVAPRGLVSGWAEVLGERVNDPARFSARVIKITLIRRYNETI